MRQWHGKDKDIVVTRLLDLTSSKSLNKNDLELLYNSLGKTLPFDSHPEMLIEWNKIGLELNNYDDLFSIFPQTSESLNNLASFQKYAGSLFLSFRNQYSEYLSNDRINEIKLVENSFELWHEFYNYSSFLFRQLSVTTNPVNQVKVLRNWLKSVSQKFARFKHKKLSFFSQPVIDYFSDFTNGDIDKIKINVQLHVSGKHERDRLNLYINDMNLFSKNILESIEISHDLEPLQELVQKSDAVQAFIDTYDEWSDVYNNLAMK